MRSIHSQRLHYLSPSEWPQLIAKKGQDQSPLLRSPLPYPIPVIEVMFSGRTNLKTHQSKILFHIDQRLENAKCVDSSFITPLAQEANILHKRLPRYPRSKQVINSLLWVDNQCQSLKISWKFSHLYHFAAWSQEVFSFLIWIENKSC